MIHLCIYSKQPKSAYHWDMYPPVSIDALFRTSFDFFQRQTDFKTVLKYVHAKEFWLGTKKGIITPFVRRGWKWRLSLERHKSDP